MTRGDVISATPLRAAAPHGMQRRRRHGGTRRGEREPSIAPPRDELCAGVNFISRMILPGGQVQGGRAERM